MKKKPNLLNVTTVGIVRLAGRSLSSATVSSLVPIVQTALVGLKSSRRCLSHLLKVYS